MIRIRIGRWYIRLDQGGTFEGYRPYLKREGSTLQERIAMMRLIKYSPGHFGAVLLKRKHQNRPVAVEA